MYTNCKYSVLDITVVVGKAKSVLALYIAFQVKALAVALSFILISNTCQFVGVPVGAANAASAAKAVTVNTSVVSQAGVGVAEEVIVLVLSVILLFVRVTVFVSVTPELSSTYFLVAACKSVVGAGIIGEELKVFTPAIVSSQVFITAQAASTLVASVTSAQSSTFINVRKLGSVKSSTLPVPAVLLANTLLVAIFCILSKSTESSVIVVAKLPVPVPVTSPVSVIVWSQVLVQLVLPIIVASASVT